MKDLGGQVLRLPPAAGPTRDEGIDAVEVSLVQLAETDRVSLRGLDQEPLVVAFRRDLYCRGHRFIRYNDQKGAKVTVAMCGFPRRRRAGRSAAAAGSAPIHDLDDEVGVAA